MKYQNSLIIVAALAAALLLGPTLSKADDRFAPYPSPEERDRQVRELAENYPDRVEVFEYGKSIKGRPLLVMRIHRPDSSGKPAAWIGGNIHGNEWIGNRMAMAVARLLLEKDGEDKLVTEAMQKMDFYIAPCINPDGYQRTYEMSTAGGKVAYSGATLTADQGDSGWGIGRKNANGVDLNRNFPMPGKFVVPVDWAGSPHPESVHYRGTHPLSEPETASIDRFFQEHPEIVGAISWHSFAAVQYPAHCPSWKCMFRYRKVCKSFKENQPHVKYPRIQSRIFDSYTGELEDWLYAEYGVLAVDVEISNKKRNREACDCEDLFWTFNPKNPEFWIENDAKAAIAAMVKAVEVTGGEPIPEEER